MWRFGVLMFAACDFSAFQASDSVDADVGSGSDAIDAPGDGAGIACDARAAWADGKQPVKTLHVSLVPGPGTPNGTPENPFQSIAATKSVATPGTQILLAAGTYQGETLTDLHGALDAPIWIEGPAAGARAILTGGPGIHLVRPAYVVLRHLDVTAVTQPGINVDDGGDRANPVAHHVIVDDVRVDNSTSSCFQFTGVQEVVIRDSTGSNCNRGVALTGVQHATVARISITGTIIAGVTMPAGSEDIDVRQSRFVNTGTRGIWIGGGSAETEFRPPLTAATGNYEASNIRVFDNVLIDSNTAVVCSNCTKSLVASNLIRGQYGAVFRLVQEYLALGAGAFQFASAGDVRYINNAIEVTGNPFGMQVVGTADGPSCAFRNNLWLEINDPGNSMPPLPSPETGGIYGMASGYDATGKLCASADGVAGGAGIALPEVPGTLDGMCRPDPPAIGPNEIDPGC